MWIGATILDNEAPDALFLILPKTELNLVIYRFASWQVWRLRSAQTSLFLGSEATGIITLASQFLLPLRCSISVIGCTVLRKGQ